MIHRIFQEHLALGKEPPTPEAVIQALIAEGVVSEAAREMAGPILEEVSACQQGTLLRQYPRTDIPFSACEWALEDQVDEGHGAKRGY